MYVIQLVLFIFTIIIVPRISLGGECPEGYFDCGENKCVNSTWVCDGEIDCENSADERGCEVKPDLSESCAKKEIKCKDGTGCVPFTWECDGEKDCPDGSDERKCNERECFGLKCGHICVPKKYICDGEEDCDDGYDEKDCLVGSDPLLIFTTGTETRGFYLRSNRSVTIRPIDSRSAGIDLDPNDERIYGFESSDTRTIFSVKIDGTDYKTFRIESLRTPDNLAVDYIAHNIYVTDSRLSQIFACKLDGNWCSVLHDKSDFKPHSIVLDIAEGFMFWSGIGEKSGIYKSGMDGSSLLHVVSNGTVMPTGLALDHTIKRIYWTDAKLNTIESSDFNGRSRQVLSRTQLQYPFSLVVFEDYLFWSHAILSSLESCNKLACHRKTVVKHEPKRNIWGVRVYHPVLKQNISNPCLLSECSQICLIRPGNSYRCVCSTGYKLSTDQKTCLKHVICRDDEILCPSTGQCISRKFICDGKADCPDKSDEENCTKSRREAISSYREKGNDLTFVSDGSTILVDEKTDANESSKWNFTLSSAMISGLAFDSKMKRLFVADLQIPTIYAFNLTSLQGQMLVVNHLISPEDIAFDWRSNNLYWVDSMKGTVEVRSVTNRKRVIIVKELEKPVSLAISPLSGNMFVSTIGDDGCVAMYGMDGKNKRILHSIQGLPMSLALHPSKKILYWTDPRAGIIFYLNYTSSRAPWILKNGINGLMSVAVSEDNLYWTASDEPLQSEIAGGVYAQSLSIYRNKAHWRRIALGSGKSFSGKSDCLINNGGCSYLCLTSQNGRTCACSAAMTLSKNRRHCYGKKCKEDDFKCTGGQCVQGEMKCDGNIDCNDGSDEWNCTQHTSAAVTVHKTLIHG